MSKVIQTEETIYEYDELDDDAKQVVVDDYLDDVWFSSYGNDRLNEAQEELKIIAEELLKDSPFKHATVNDIHYDFSYSQGSGAMFCFDYEQDNFGLDFPNINELLVEKFETEEAWRQSYCLEKEHCNELIDALKTKETNALFDINLIVSHTGGRYINHDIDLKVYCYANSDIRYCLEEMLEDWIYRTFIENSELIDDIESDFSYKAYKWYDDMRNIENYSSDSFAGYYYENGKFAGYDDDFE